ncbi:MAG: HAMP domain-containing protein [Candidatus Omnitrophica bacterium]|nr:HAMP domain-containing protein [Candidatus Omnitrophota bacterium]
MKLNQKLILGFLVLAALVAVIGYVSFYISRATLEQHIKESSVSLAVETLDKIDRHIYSKIETFQEYSKDLILQKSILESNQEFEKLDDIQAYIVSKDEAWVSSQKTTITPFMQELINNILSLELKEKVGFYEKKYDYRVLGEVFVTNKYGANVAQTGKTSDYKQDDEAWWQEARENSLYIRDVQYDESAGVYSTDIGIRIDDDYGNFIGVIKIVLNIKEAINIIRSIGPSERYPSRYFRLLNKDGTLIYSTKTERDFEIFKDVSEEQFFKKIEKGNGFFIGHEPEEEKMLFAYAYSKGYRDFKGLAWILIVEHDAKEIFAPVDKLKNILLFISLIVTLFALLTGALISRSILKPIRKLMTATVKIGKGQLDAKVEVKSKDEIGILAASFNRMTDELKESTTSVENLNREMEARKKTEEALKRAYKELKEKEQELVQAEKMAALGTISAGMAHEINNPLMGIMLLVQNLASQKREEKEQKALSFIDNGLKRIEGVVSKLLAFSRKEKLILRKENINNIIEETIPFISHEFVSNDIELVKDYGRDLPDLDVSSNAMQQVFMNILLNAKDSVLDLGSKKITIATYMENDAVKIKLKDEGCGIKKEDLKKVFDPFFTTKAVGKGLGMGMSIVRNIIEQHGGKISINSEEKKGTEIIISLPVPA